MRGKVAEVKQEDGDYCPSPISVTTGLPGSSSSEATPENSDSEAEATVGRASSLKRRLRRELDDAPAKKPKKNPNPGRRIIGGRVYDSMLGETCHWCRQKTVEDHVHCIKCPIKFCGLCLANRNGENIKDEMEQDVEWICPKCRGGCGAGCENCCNCGPCRKLQGLEPTGALVQRARTVGFTNVHDYLVHLKTGESAEEITKRKIGRNWIKGEGATAVKFVRNPLWTPVKQSQSCSQSQDACTPTPVKRMRGALTSDSLSLHLSQSQSQPRLSQAQSEFEELAPTNKRFGCILNSSFQEENSAPEVKQEPADDSPLVGTLKVEKMDVVGIEDVVKSEKTDSSKEGSPVRDIKEQVQTEKMAVVEDVGVVVKVEKMDDPDEGSPVKNEVVQVQAEDVETDVSPAVGTLNAEKMDVEIEDVRTVVKREKADSPKEVRDIKEQVQTEKMAVVEDVGVVVTVEKMDHLGEGSPVKNEVVQVQAEDVETDVSPAVGTLNAEKMAVEIEDVRTVVKREKADSPKEVRDIKEQVQPEKMAVVEDVGVVVTVEKMDHLGEGSPVRDEVVQGQVQAEDVETVGQNENNSGMDEDGDVDKDMGVDHESEETAESDYYHETSGSEDEVSLDDDSDDEEDEEDIEVDADDGNVNGDMDKEACEVELERSHEDDMHEDQTMKDNGVCNYTHLLGAIEEEHENDIEQERRALEHAAKFRASLRRSGMVHSSFGHLIESAPGVKQEFVGSFESESEEEDDMRATQDSSVTESSGLNSNTSRGLGDEGFVPLRDVGRIYSEQLQKELEKPFDPRQLAEMLEEASKRKAILRHRETRQRTVCVETQNEGPSYLDHHPDLAAKLVSVKDPQGKLQLLRGFFFWLQRACNPGAYKPWVSSLKRSNQIGDDCCEVDGPDCEITAVVVSVDEKRAARNLFRNNGRYGQSDPGASPMKNFSGEFVKVKSEVIEDED